MLGDIAANTFDLKGEEWAIEPSAAGGIRPLAA